MNKLYALALVPVAALAITACGSKPLSTAQQIANCSDAYQTLQDIPPGSNEGPGSQYSKDATAAVSACKGLPLAQRQSLAGISPTTPTTQVTDPSGGVCSALQANGYCPGDSPAPTTPPPPQYTMSQQQAIDAMTNYLIDGQGFSYQGLINQLSSQYGNGFSVADATFAVNTVSTEHLWDTQAAISAQNYMTSEPGWSACGLVQQLDSPYGGYFTQAQAEYGAQSVGLGTC